jgi:A/G-specific adenine glycosylase
VKTLVSCNIEKFRKDLIDWFIQEQRQLPWRLNKDPYRVWVSEIMLQQTRVDTVIPYYERFMEWFPTLEDFAEADEERYLKAWEGLGYYSRVRNLHSAVKEVKENYGGVVPNTPEEIKKLKGVGPYTAGAILSIAYGVPEPAVDGNVMRVISRILEIYDDIAKPATRKIFETAVRELIDPEHTSEFNQALMELGALICVPGKPACLLCPVREHCQAFDQGIQQELPVKTKAKKTKVVQLSALVITDDNGRILIRKRPETGLLAGLWEFPSYETTGDIKELKEMVAKQNQVELDHLTPIGHINHVFSHLVWEIDIYTATVNNLESFKSDTHKVAYIKDEDFQQYALPVSHQKIYEAYVFNG